MAILPVLLKGFIPFVRMRLNFERQNLIQPLCRSFRESQIQAQLCFEVSSEGELEQVRPLMEEELHRGGRIEILFSSPSVEKKIEQLAAQFPEKVRYLRLPLLSFWPFSFLYFQNFWIWVTSPVMVFCRYDFFPELLLLKLFRKKFILVSGATKKPGLYKNLAYQLFDLVVAATPFEEKKFKQLVSADVLFCDLRIPRIVKRKTEAKEVLFKNSDEQIVQYCHEIEIVKNREKIIFGSFWPSDLPVLESHELIEKVKKYQLHLGIVPHKLDKKHVSLLKNELCRIFGSELVSVLSEQNNLSPVTIVDKSGILCELYTLFNLAYVGGGYERSIHSVLEPFFSGCAVICGPKINRSTEYDLIAEAAFSEIHVLKNPVSFYTIVKGLQEITPDQSIREAMLNHALMNKQSIIDKIQKLRV